MRPLYRAFPFKKIKINPEVKALNIFYDEQKKTEIYVLGKKTDIFSNNWENIYLHLVKGAKCSRYAEDRAEAVYKLLSPKSAVLKTSKNGNTYRWKKHITKMKTWYWTKDDERETKEIGKQIYNIYGKNNKSDSYRFIKTTGKNSVKTKYKYVRVVSNEWNV